MCLAVNGASWSPCWCECLSCCQRLWLSVGGRGRVDDSLDPMDPAAYSDVPRYVCTCAALCFAVFAHFWLCCSPWVWMRDSQQSWRAAIRCTGPVVSVKLLGIRWIDWTASTLLCCQIQMSLTVWSCDSCEWKGRYEPMLFEPPPENRRRSLGDCIPLY